MKRKSIFVIGSALAAAALVGGTFAAWAITDKADPFHISISPGDIDTGDTKSVTLEWGSRTLINIPGIKLGEEKGPYEVGLKATTSSSETFTGNLSLSLSSAETGAVKLLDYLNVTVWEEAAKEHKVLEISNAGKESKVYTANKDITVTSSVEKKVYVTVAIDESMTPAQFTEVQESVVDLAVDWNKGSNVPVVEAVTYYFNNSANWEEVYAYAWSDNTANAVWPGVKMAQAKGSIYSIALDATLENVIFNNGSGLKTDDLTLDVTKPYYDGEWKVAPDLEAETEYYLVGTFSEWQPAAAYKLVASEKEGYAFEIKDVELTANSELKVVSSENHWYGEHSAEHDAPNMTIGQAGTYDFYFNPEPESTNPYIHCERQQVFAIHHGSGETWTDTALALEAGENPDEYVGTVTLAEGEEFIFNMDGDWRGWAQLKTGEGNAHANFEQAGESNNLKVKEGKGGTYDVFVAITPEEGKSIWIIVHAGE